LVTQTARKKVWTDYIASNECRVVTLTAWSLDWLDRQLARSVEWLFRQLASSADWLQRQVVWTGFTDS
jgi:hypothetical protein